MRYLADTLAINLPHLPIVLLSVFFTFPDTCLIYTDAWSHGALHMRPVEEVLSKDSEHKGLTSPHPCQPGEPLVELLLVWWSCLLIGDC